MLNNLIYEWPAEPEEACIHRSGNRPLAVFHFEVLPLFEKDARIYVEKNLLCMYPLVPTMQHVDLPLLRKVMNELAAAYSDRPTMLVLFQHTFEGMGKKRGHL
ncbi:MAG: hypothetical protein IMW89_22800, partial [Ktedonobacteraceae bacterium]|nr:hypothetical protein [Ktedonobacteraceae bacterium]